MFLSKTSLLLCRHLDVLLEEAKKLMEFCEHDGILHLHGLIMQRDNYSLILEYMPLGSLIDFRKQFTPRFPLFVRFFMQVSSAMDFLHSHKPTILHLDLKADNILLDGAMNAKVWYGKKCLPSPDWVWWKGNSFFFQSCMHLNQIGNHFSKITWFSTKNGNS